jgi:hypothetical protein
LILCSFIYFYLHHRVGIGNRSILSVNSVSHMTSLQYKRHREEGQKKKKKRAQVPKSRARDAARSKTKTRGAQTTTARLIARLLGKGTPLDPGLSAVAGHGPQRWTQAAPKSNPPVIALADTRTSHTHWKAMECCCSSGQRELRWRAVARAETLDRG